MVIETLTCSYDCEGQAREYTYRLIERDLNIEIDGDSQCIKAYGVKVESSGCDKEKDVQGIVEEFKYITPYKNKGSQFLHMLQRNMVSPIHLIDIAEEVVDEYYKDFDKEINKRINTVTI